MRRWLTASAQAASHVADRADLWLPGALAWMATVGWLVLMAGVARPPTVAELTFLGAGLVTSGAWPWNGIALALAAALLAAVAVGLASVAEAFLVHGARASLADVRRTLLVGLMCVAPLAVVVIALLVALSFVAPGEFNAPEQSSGPLLGTLLALAPFVLAMLLAAVLGSATHAAAIRAGRHEGAVHAVRGAPGVLAAVGPTALAQVLALLLARIGYVVLAAVLLRVLWAPIDTRLGQEGFGLATTLLLLGFVAIWLCLVLAGGALHAWGSVSWTRILDGRGREAGAVAHMESRSRP